mmetsp:Transcript_17669/g.51427  ORF Transcript_17669/g.51427 Transcript_17669/m.51427 type:complete len:531 (-) Transcript_17669:86-1678(-)
MDPFLSFPFYAFLLGFFASCSGAFITKPQIYLVGGVAPARRKHPAPSYLSRTISKQAGAIGPLAVDEEDEEVDDVSDEEDFSVSFEDEVPPVDYTTEREHAKKRLEDDTAFCTLPKGIPDGFFVVDQHVIPTEGFNMSLAREVFGENQIERVSLRSDNVTMAACLMMIDQERYPTISRARKALRKGYILLHRGPLGVDPETGRKNSFDPASCIRARVKDRVYPDDVVCEQARLGNAFYPTDDGAKPPFELPVVYEDDHFAIVNKPSGVNVNSHRKSGTGRISVRSAAPYALSPPRFGTLAIIRRPSPVHRLDKPTSGLLLIAKTKPAMVELTRQFKYRVVKKTYTAIVNGAPVELDDRSITSKDAHELGVDVGHSDTDDSGDKAEWQCIDRSLEDKSAVTVWRPLRRVENEKAKDGVLTLVELKPKSGRYHQLRRHMAWECQRPLVGDKTYSGEIELQHQFLDHGLYLCSNKVTLEHPYYNTETGRREWEAMDDAAKYCGGMIRLSEGGRRVLVHAEIPVPQDFYDLLES